MIVISRAAEDDLSVPVGFRFHPTDEELVTHYLKKKLKGMDSHVSNIIREIDILKFEPWDLPSNYQQIPVLKVFSLPHFSFAFQSIWKSLYAIGSNPNVVFLLFLPNPSS